MAINVIQDDLDETIRVNTSNVDFQAVPITDEMREVMARLIDPLVAEHELTFRERKIALFYGWLP